MKFLNNIKEKYTSTECGADSGDMVQTIFIVGTFAVVSIFVVSALAGAFDNRGQNAGDCLDNIDPHNSQKVLTACDDWTPSSGG